MARTLDTNPAHLTETLKQAASHKGTAFVEIFQNCVIFNDGAFEEVTGKETRDDTSLFLKHGQPLLFGKEKNKGIRLNGFQPEVVMLGENGITEKDLVVHDETQKDPTYAFMLSRMERPEFPVPLGVFRKVEKPTYDALVNTQIEEAKLKKAGDFVKILRGSNTWMVQ